MLEPSLSVRPYAVEFEPHMRNVGMFMRQFNLASTCTSVETPGLCVSSTDEEKPLNTEATHAFISVRMRAT